MNEKDQKLQRIIELAKIADALTATQAKQFVELLVNLTNEQKKELVKKFNEFADTVSQETHQKITEAISIISEKHKDAMLEVRQLSNKQKKAHEDIMSKCMDMLIEIQSIEIQNGIDGEDGTDGKDGSPDTPEEIKTKLETLTGENRLDISAIKGADKLSTQANLDRAIGILDQRTRFLINKPTGTTSTGGGHTIQDEGTPLTQRTNLNFVGAGVTVTDDAGNNATVVTIPGGSGSGITRSISSISGITAAGSTASTDYVYICTATLTLTLPTAVGNTNLYTVKTITGTTTVATTGGQTIDSGANDSISVANTSHSYISDGANWIIV